MLGAGRRIRRTRSGEFTLRFPQAERRILRTLPGELRELLQDSDDPQAERLFPPAYTQDASREEEYRVLARDELVAGRLEALDLMESTIDAQRISEEQLLGWLSALNDLRLVLGTRLHVTEDLRLDTVADDDPQAPAYAMYGYLTWLQEQVVGALSGQ
jgi:Domain of unknown function (DUF2017)